MNTAAFIPLCKQDVAGILGVSIRTVENFVTRGRMPAPAHIGARVLWHPDVFYAWLDHALRNGGWKEDSEGDHPDLIKPDIGVARATVAPKAGKTSRSLPSVASRLQARQVRLLSTGAPE